MQSQGRWGNFLRAVVLCCTAVSGTPVAALETSLVVPDAPAELADRLVGASAVMAARSRGLSTVQELLAASLSDYRTLVQVLYDEGYFSPVVHIRMDGREAADIKPLNLPATVNRIEVTVDPGRPFRFGQAKIAPLAPETELPAEFAPGQAASTRILEDAAIAGQRGWRNAGHPKVRVGRQRIVARHREAELDADIELVPGPELRFGKMYISGQTAVRPESIYRIAGFPTGEVYHPDRVQRVGTRLRRTGTFNAVTLQERDQPNPDGTLDFDATFEDLPPRRLTFGASLSSRDGLDLSVMWMHRNLFGGAERLQAQARIRNIGGAEDVDGVVSIRLERPDRLGPDDSIFYLAELEKRNRTNYQILRGLAGLGVRRYFADDLYGEASFGLAYGKSDDAFGTDRVFRYAVLPVRLAWDKRDSKVSAERGFFLAAGLTPFTGLSGTESGGQVKLDARGYWSPMQSGRVVLAGRVQVGSVLNASLSGVSPDFLFFSGGAGTVRGQPYESLGVPVGTSISGGRSFLGFSAELRGHVTEKISLVGFLDGGAIDSTPLVGSGSTRHTGAGLGLRYDLGGLGPVRLDLAWPTSGTTGEGMQFYIGIGQAF